MFDDVLLRHPGGAALCVYRDGKAVVDLWGGEAAPGVPWSADTACVIWSVTKALTALAVQQLVERGVVDLAAPVCRYWPEFAARGKDAVTVHHVLTHTAGLPWWPGHERLVRMGDAEGWDRTDEIADALAGSVLQWQPGALLGYHAFTYGWLLGEVIRRATGRDVTAHVAEEIARPLAARVAIGLPGEWEKDAAELLPPRRPADPAEATRFADRWHPGTPQGHALLGAGPEAGYLVATTANSAAFRRGEVPGANGFASARGIARVFAALAQGGTLDGAAVTSPDGLQRHTAVHAEGYDVVAGGPARRALGYARPVPTEMFSPYDRAFGHGGLGGQLGFADPDRRLSFAFLSNYPQWSDGLDPRLLRLVGSVYDAVWRLP
ncbi:serine hydrolase domain-containing protein [Dactylosporangium sp. AC04546]|uniref:serine hydrolase domain-containing protein n=1 Tax=Dactylosporangium sp. AC04546 TaxID=2862460 RepID=UPI001EE10BDF|nr:serine hydrolase domain-containing protein [Dactylosporangium sp. AC04546]WVK81073.1 serine hydrolase domain-containing protein [Dactylosporangium sp. AC04546]